MDDERKDVDGPIEDEDYKEKDTNYYKLAQEIDSLVSSLSPIQKSTSSFDSVFREDF